MYYSGTISITINFYSCTNHSNWYHLNKNCGVTEGSLVPTGQIKNLIRVQTLRRLAISKI